VKDQESALLVEAGSGSEIARAVVQLFRDPELARKIAAGASAAAESRSPEQRRARLTEIYQKVARPAR